MKFRLGAFGPAAWAASAVLALMLAAWSSPAAAQASRTWVSGVGDDANPCSRTAPCKTFAGAISKTAASGEINCIDPGGFGGVTILKAITINCEAVTAGVLVSATPGITVNVAATDFVQLRGLDFEGLGPPSATPDGVRMIGAGNLAIINCQINGFQNAGNGHGVSLAGAANAHILIENTLIRNNDIGVIVAPTAGANSVTIDRSTLEGNLTTNVQVNAGGIAVLSNNTIAGTPTALGFGAGTPTASVISYGNNFIRNAGVPTSTLPLQ